MSLREDLQQFEGLAQSSGIPARIYQAQIELIAKQADFDKRRMLRRELTARKMQMQQRLETLQGLPADTVKSAWCADYTENLSGEVGTVEIPGEGQEKIVIRPGFEEAAAYTPARDGALNFRAGQSPEQVYFNAAILPGWQKWMPLFRAGEITAMDYTADTADVTLDAETSSAQGLGIDPLGTVNLQDVPVEYMECNAAVFTVGDRVVVKFREQNPADPVVIGFESEPKPCDIIVGHPIVLTFVPNGQINLDPICHPDLSAQVRTGWHTLNTKAYRLRLRDGARAVIMRDFDQLDTAQFTLDVQYDFINNSAIGQFTHVIEDNLETPSITIDVLRRLDIQENPTDPADCTDPDKLQTRTYHLAGHDSIFGRSPYDEVIVHYVTGDLLPYTLAGPTGPLAYTWSFAQSVEYGIFTEYPESMEDGRGYFFTSYETDRENPWAQVNISLMLSDFPEVVFSPTGLQVDQKTYEPIEILKHLTGGGGGIADLMMVRHRVKPAP